jgi:hypothetical protein
MRVTELIIKLHKLPPTATIELHNGQPRVKIADGQYRRLVDYAITTLIQEKVHG